MVSKLRWIESLIKISSSHPAIYIAPDENDSAVEISKEVSNP
jgi:hypothetical protein